MRQKHSESVSIDQLVSDIETLADRMGTTRARPAYPERNAPHYGDDAARADIEGTPYRTAPRTNPTPPGPDQNRAERLRIKLGSLARKVESMSHQHAEAPHMQQPQAAPHPRPQVRLSPDLAPQAPVQAPAQPPVQSPARTARPVDLKKTLQRISDDQRKQSNIALSQHEFDQTITRHFNSLAGQIGELLQSPKQPDPFSERLAGEVGELRLQLADMPRRDDLRSVQDQLDVIRTRLDQEPELSALEQRLEMLGRTISNQIQSATRPVEMMIDRFAAVENALAQIGNTDRFDQLEWRLDTVIERIRDIESAGGRTDVLDALQSELVTLTQMMSRGSMDERFDKLEQQMDVLADHLADASDNQSLGAIAEQLDRIAAEVDAVQNLTDSNRLESALEKVEQRLDGLASEIGILAKKPHGPAAPLDDLIERVEQAFAKAPDPNSFADLDNQIGALTQHLQNAGAGDDMSVLAREIRDLSSKVDQAAGNGLDQASIQQLDERVNDLADLITAMSSQEPAQQDGLLDTIRDTVTNALAAGPSQPSNDALLSQLQQDMQALLQREAKPDQNTHKALEQMHLALERLATRMDALETAPAPAPVQAPVQAQAPAMPAPSQALETPPVSPPSDLDALLDQDEAPLAPMGSAAKGDDRNWDMDHGPINAAEPNLDDVLSQAISDDLDQHTTEQDSLEGDALLAPGQRPDFGRLDNSDKAMPAEGDAAAAGGEQPRSDFIAAARRAAQAATETDRDAKLKRSVRTAGADALRARLSSVNDEETGSGLTDEEAEKAARSRKRILILAIATIVLGVGTLTMGQLKPGGLLNPTPPVVEAPATPAEQLHTPEPEVTGSINRSAVTGHQDLASILPEQSPPKDITYSPVDDTFDYTDADDALPDATQASGTELSRLDTNAAGPTVPMPPIEIGSERLRLAAASGDPIAQFEVAARFTHGEGVVRDLKQAATWYEHAARSGLAPAQYRLGSLYEKGEGVDRSVEQAIRWYTSAADLGNTKAMHNLAVLYAGNARGKPDFKQAVHWFTMAAEHGVRDSQYNLGILHFKGLGVKRNPSMSYQWFALAAQQGDRDSASKRDKVAATMTPEELREVESRIAIWKARKAPDLANVVLQPEDGWADALPSAISQITNSPALDRVGQISQAQSLLGKLGYEAGPADGVMGPKTREAISSFQRASGMQVTGQVDQQLMTALTAHAQ
ncbi:peptidoglycan-binding protein [Coralliovum pocilloporae]|uniref:peptidoglycan-binding protein n=1 Tax=Coralliovum pocilloporae TaxID=3066369 RepID=UPI003306A7E3